MLKTSVKKAVGRITAGVAAVILVAGGGVGFVGQPAWGEGVSSNDWVVDGGVQGTDWDTDRTGTLTIKRPGNYTVKRTGNSDCRIVFDEEFGQRTTLTLGNVNCEKNETGAGLDPNGSGVTLVLAEEARFGSSYESPAVRAQGADEDHRVEITSIEGEGSAKGSLTAENMARSAGIGGGDGGTGSYIRIIGGTVTASGGLDGGAGIGGGVGGAGSHITITGGTVTVLPRAGDSAGIGGGVGGTGSDITIAGGTVTAWGGGNGGAGIGGGAGGAGSNIRISDGDVTATGDRGAGIGGGNGGAGSGITISGGHVTASGQIGAGIGGGEGGPGSDITILGGAVDATGGFGGAGIGGGAGFYAHNVNINGGTVTVTGGCSSDDGCGLAIGHGGLSSRDDDPVKSDSVAITGGSVKTSDEWEFAQIGGITDQANPPLALLTIRADWVKEKNQIAVDDTPWKRSGAHPHNDWMWYAWLPKKSHHLRLGHLSCDVTWTGAEFVNTCETAYPVIDPDHLPVGTMSSVTVNILDPTALGGAEYSIDEGKTWQPSNTFSDLAAGTPYHVWARYTGDATRSPSEHLVVDVQTAPRIAPPSVLTSPVYSGQKFGDLKLSEVWTWGNWENSYVSWPPFGDSYETYEHGAGLYKVVSAPAGQHFSYAEQDLPGTSCRFSGLSAGAAVTVQCDVVFTVSRAPNKWTTPVSITGWDFGQESHQPVGVAEYGQVKFSYSGTLTDGSPYGPTEDVPTHAGRYTLTATVDKGAKDVGVKTGFGPEVDRDYYLRYQGLSDTKEFEIRQAGNGWVTVPSIVPWTFGQTPSTPVGKALHGDVEFSYRSAGDPSAEFVPWDDGPSAAGAYLLRAVVKDPDYGDLEKIVSFSVDQADAVFSQPAAKSGLVYTAQGQELVSGGVSEHGRFEYSLNGTDWSESVPTSVEAGQYQVRWRFVPDGNHIAGQGASGSVTVGISAVEPTVTAQPAGSILFGQGFADAGVMVSATFDGKSVAGSTEWFDIDQELSAGSHEFTGTFTPTDTRNFESVQVRVTVQVDAVAAVFSQPVAKPGLVYTAQGQELVSGGVSEHGRFEYSLDGERWDAAVPVGVEAGQYQVWWRFVPDGNHTAGQGASGMVTVGIAAVKPTVTVQASRAISFGQGFADAGVTVSAVFDGKPVAGTTQWDGTDRELTVGSHKFTGTFTPTDTRNFESVTVTVSVQVDAVAAVVNGLEAVKNLVFNGKPQALVSAPAVTGGTVEYAVGSARPANDSQAWLSELPEAVDAGEYTVFWRVVPDENHTAIGGEVRVTVAAAGPTVTAKPGHPITYGQKFADAGVTVSAQLGGKTVEGTTQWANTDRELSAGTHKFTGTFTPKDTKNFKAVPVTVTVEVKQIPAVVSGLEAVKNLVFTGAPQVLATSPTVTGGTVEYAVGATRPADDSQDWSRDLPKASDAGDYTVFWRVVPDGNHTEAHGQVPVTIAPKVAAVDGQLAHGFTFVAENGEYVIRDGQTRLSFGTDYTFELVNASFESQTADVEITFSGDYTGFVVVKNAMATEWGGVGPVEWKPGSGDVSLDLGEEAAPVSGVQVDDKPLEQGKFHRTGDGKLVVDSSVLEGLAPGDHTLEVRLEDGSVIVYPIRVLPADKPAPLFTGEWLAWLLTWPILLWMVLRTFAPWMLPFFLR